MVVRSDMKCTECEHFDEVTRECTKADSDLGLAADQDIYCGIMDNQSEYFN